MPYSTPSNRSTGDLITSAIWNQDVVANSKVIDPSAATEGQVLKVNAGLDGYDFGEAAAMKRTTGGGFFLLPAGPTQGTSVQSPASANTYGSWTELSSSAPGDMLITHVLIGRVSGEVNGYQQIDIGTGAAASETSRGELKVQSVSATPGQYQNPTPLATPIKVSSGERIAARVADADASARTHTITLTCVLVADLEGF